MNEKVQWHSTDLLGQIIMFCPVLFLLIGDYGTASYGYFSVGVWQSVSAIRYHRKWPNDQSESRKYYRLSLPWVLIGTVILLPFALYFLLFGTPLMAVWYLTIVIGDFRRESRLARRSDDRQQEP